MQRERSSFARPPARCEQFEHRHGAADADAADVDGR